MNFQDHRGLAALFVAGLALGLAAPVALARPIVHVSATPGSSNAYLIDWRAAGRVTLVGGEGRSEGRYVTTGAQRVITLGAPFVTTYYGEDPDCPGVQHEFRIDIRQIGVTRTSGTESRGESSVVQAGTLTTVTGCNAGRVEPYGSLSDAGFPTRHLDMTLRPSIADLVPGTALAGPSEEPAPEAEYFLAADVMGLEAGAGRFAATGHVHPLATVDGWLVLDLPGMQRAYTRVAVERNGAETWVRAVWAGGLPQRVFQTLMVKPADGAGFGTVRQASRMWESGLFIGSPVTTFAIHLYRDGTGERISRDVASGTESRQPITWVFNGASIVQSRPLGGGTGERTWQPLRNSGVNRFVMESEIRRLPDGSVLPFVKPRVNFYVDTGAATPPPAP